MYTIEEMNNWNYETAWQFFTINAFNRYIPETKLYVQSLKASSKTIDIRDDKDARKKILESLNARTLILMDGSSLNGKTTFAERLALTIGAKVVDIDIICKEWIDEQLMNKNDIEKYLFLSELDKLTDTYILENLENIIKTKSTSSVILVGSYLEVIYRSVIVKTLGRYFEQVVSIYCCSKSFEDVKMMMEHREAEFGCTPEIRGKIFYDYKYSQRLLQANGIMLGFGMEASFIADINVSDMFV